MPFRFFQLFVLILINLNLIKKCGHGTQCSNNSCILNKQARTSYPPVVGECGEIAVGPVQKFWYPAVVALAEPRVLRCLLPCSSCTRTPTAWSGERRRPAGIWNRLGWTGAWKSSTWPRKPRGPSPLKLINTFSWSRIKKSKWNRRLNRNKHLP